MGICYDQVTNGDFHFFLKKRNFLFYFCSLLFVTIVALCIHSTDVQTWEESASLELQPFDQRFKPLKASADSSCSKMKGTETSLFGVWGWGETSVYSWVPSASFCQLAVFFRSLLGQSFRTLTPNLQQLQILTTHTLNACATLSALQLLQYKGVLRKG